MSAGLNQLATIIKRLEAATSRLEDLAVTGATASTSTDAGVPPTTPAPPSHPTPTTGGAAVSSGSSATSAPIPPSVESYDANVIEGKLKPWLTLTRSFGAPSLIDQTGSVEKMFANQRTLLLTAAACKKPSEKELGDLLKPLTEDLAAISKAKETYRKEREWQSHLTFIAEGASAVGWVSLSAKPGPHVKEMADAAQYYGNRVLKEFKDKDPKHGEFVKGYLQLWEALRQFVVEFHTTGLAWNTRNGIEVKDYKPASKSAATTVGGGPPPPPPPPGPPAPPPPAAASPAPAAGGGGGIGAIFADLNKGEAITSSLRKVDKSEMTHKNPALRAQPAPVPKAPANAATAGKRPTLPRKPESLMAKKPSKFVLEGNKWLIEYQDGETLTVDETDRNHTINLFGCKNTTVIVKGKVNAVTLVNCKKTSVLVESVISSISITASDNFTVQVTGTSPTLQIDTTNSGQVYLSRACLEQVEIITAKCSAINISLPVEGEEEGVFEEKAVPEMFRSTVKDGKLVTSIVEHSG